MSIKGRNNKDIDYFSIIHTLRTFDIELENIISLRESEKFFSKVMSYIYTNSILADYFKEQLQIFLKGVSNIEYSILYKKSYNKVKDITETIANKNNTKIDYCRYGNVNFNSTFQFSGLCDIPMIYMYPSIGLLQYINPEEQNVSTFEISESLIAMYKKFNKQYQSLEIIENVEFYVVLFISYNSISKKYNKEYIRENINTYLLTSMRYVLIKIIKFISDKIETLYINKNSIRLVYAIDAEQDVYTLVYKEKQDKLYIDSIPFELSPVLFQILKFILAIELQDSNKLKPEYIKQDVSRINKKAKEIINQNLLEYKHKKYVLKPNIKLNERN